MINFVLLNFNIYASEIVLQMGHEENFFFKCSRFPRKNKQKGVKNELE